MKNSPLVYILVLNYNSAEDTLACVKKIKEIDYSNLRLLVIDNHSPDGSGQILKDKIEPDEFLLLPKNYGYAGGNNKGIKIAIENNADYILIVNPDIRLPSDTLTQHINIMQSDSNIAGLNSIQLQADEQSFDKNFILGILKPNGFEGNTLQEAKLPELFDSPLIFGASLLLSVNAIKQVGGFDPLFFAYGEEIDLCRRLRMHNFRLVITTKAPTIHLRTIYAKPLSKFVLFLRLKGYYLSRFKNPDSSIKKQIKPIFREIKAALKGQAKEIYPYNTYPYNKTIIIKAALWLICFLPSAYIHKIKEKKANAHYIF